MTKKIRVGVIGVGGIARMEHLPYYQKEAGVEVVAVCDVNEQVAQQVAKDFAVPRVYSDYRDLAQDQDIDAVSVCTPNYLHRDPTVACLNAGKHVLVEKPIARNVREGLAMVRAAQKNQRVLAVGLQFRYHPAVTAMRRFRDAGGFGEVYFARVYALRRRGIPGWGVFIDKEKQGGGPLIDIGVHMLYAAMYVLDFPTPLSVSGVTYTKFGHKKAGVAPWGAWDHKRFTVEDYAAALVRFANGMTMSLEASFAANLEGGSNFWILGDTGGAQFSPCTFFREEFGTLTNTTPGWLPKERQYADQIADFCRAIRDQSEPGVTGYQGLLVTQIMDGIYRSAATGREVKIPPLKL